ncbi:methyltransferase [Adhaeribacter rhizoryzae]|uniref:Methyltransferase domain-containing protein n=1 Tax=Adhaeribacter rhizoryzae TaxID=2607907 RepID=A0A5M6D4D3_9BACT|nr:methyltransferase [Adhaeribacter rhizoryzae]KAA5541152.1 methyltransferase domain-containing protein [Adhaeribacter rhizoryzae]
MPTPSLDLAPITRHLRAMAGSRILIAAVHHIPVFEALQNGPLSFTDLAQQLGLKERPAMVVFPALCAMEMLAYNSEGNLTLTPLGQYLTQNQQPNLIGYTGLEKNDPGVLALTQFLRHDGPTDTTHGVTYVKDGDAPSPMDDPEAARFLTLALAGRAEYLAPVVAEKLTQSNGHLLDVAAGTGFYTYEWLLANPEATATVFDRPEVLKVAQELLNTFCQSGRNNAAGVRERVKFMAGDMLHDELPQTDLLLAASLFHDWPTETCISLTQKFAKALKPGGELWVHDAFLNDTLDGPLAATDYSVMLFTGTKGRIYSRQEHRAWFTQAVLIPARENIPTLLDYNLISARKPE